MTCRSSSHSDSTLLESRYTPPQEKKVGKSVTFEYLMSEPLERKARLPMRVKIWPHDCTESIIATVKNFYGLYDGNGISFEDKHGNTLIAQYDNFYHDMTVYVRVVEGINPAGTPRNSASPKRRRLEPPFELQPGRDISRPSSRALLKRSTSPTANRSQRSVSASTSAKFRSRPNLKGQGSSHGSLVDAHGDGHDGSDSEGGNGSVTSSRRGKVDVLASAEISVDNIVEGGRRKRPRFDSSELPLFVPSQVPMHTSQSSISPQRRVSNNGASPYQPPYHQPFAYTPALPSPQSNGQLEQWHMPSGSAYAQGNGARHRGSFQYGGPRPGYGPTPDPSISVISDEDVAFQLMRLGDASNFSSHGRLSASTVDDALSGKAEVASSAGDASDEEAPHNCTQPNGGRYESEEYHSGEDCDDHRDGSFKGESDGLQPEANGFAKPLEPKTNGVPQRARSTTAPRKILKPAKIRTQAPGKTKVKTEPGAKMPMSPASLPAQSRKTSAASAAAKIDLGPDEEDLSSKPRCQRCRKSKKGCDRQRPCGRCRDAGLTIHDCVSEDEGNGRKGRYGRHMGVIIKKDQPMAIEAPLTGITTSMAPPPLAGNNKKRKR
ncbi:hypothetical protein EJ06DRAFT_481536 [Trichodelitschia bisporula]|uniref:Zn(2)-C6 fungal-type domain-containing protein n=1 Tax=Trichodelitschia bisporula TaxID=703511 RepID=A0A6G1HP59_9PEZI|nr:hypothetical protein EJ06DRAFT_481536 [Trichodelitschia bisporula]